MTVKEFIKVSLLATMLAVAPAAAHDTPNCDALEDGLGMRTGINSNLDFDGGDLSFRDNGEVVMLITAERELYLHGKRVELDARGQKLVDRYYDTVDRFVDDAIDLAGDAAGLGVSAAMEALSAIFAGNDERDRVEKRIEERARRIEKQADIMCERIYLIEGIEQEMQEVVPGFEPVMFTARDSE